MAHPTLLREFQDSEGELVAFMTTRLRCPFTARDLVQELYLKIASLDAGQEIGNARAYLFRMAANLATDHQRSERRRSDILAEAEDLLWGPTEASSPERQAMAREELRDLDRTIARMSPRTRQIFRLNRFGGWTQKQIAEALGISQTAVEKHIRRALSMLAASRHQP